MAAFGLLAMGCAEKVKIDVRPESLLMKVDDIQDESCGPWESEGVRHGDKKRGAVATSLIRWETPDGCEVGMSVFSYGDTGDAKSAFKKQGPRQWWGDIWPYDPVKVEVTVPVAADAHELLCIGGSGEPGCFNWAYWARYGSHLVELESFGLDRQDRYVSKEAFMRTLGNMDSRMVTMLKQSQ
ncbi:hypothetical protein [Streptomyces qinzhouensis]|uniref:Uncharacterized protein n=1 Tax=Streptomyces qinzhouensis TaxID=2599401 RepID=A0A5B8J6N1_9ACTN|nr:hypothetical protein [Streptomyces qinzhouensis]QDY76987.1 hypothetical protein FQU76_11180 [Streptomyces qinzhouensis]